MGLSSKTNDIMPHTGGANDVLPHIAGSGAAVVVTGPDVPVINYDLTTMAGVTASGIVTTRTGTTLYPQQSASTAVAVGNNAAIWEDYGTDDSRDPAAGGGLWSFDTYLNSFASPFDFSAGWTMDAGVAYTANVGNGPDGTANADRILDTSAVARQAVYRTGATNPSHFDLWYQNDPGTPPTAPGVLGQDNTPTTFVALTSTANWRRAHLEAVSPSNFTIIAAGGTVLGETGGIRVWGAQITTGTNAARFALPQTADGAAAGICTNALKAGDLASIVSNGAINITLRYRPTEDELNYFQTGSAPYCLASATIGGKEYSIWWGRNAASTDRCFNVKANGIEVFSVTSASTSTNTIASSSWMQGDEIVLHWYMDAGAVRIRQEVNGAVFAELSGAYNGVPLTTCTAFSLGSNGTVANTCARVRFTGFKVFNSYRDWTAMPTVQVVVIGDSTMGANGTDFIPISTQLITVTEARAGYRIGNITKQSETMVLQLAKWQACPWRGDTNVRAVVIGHTVNDSNNGTTAAAQSATAQSLINDIAAQNPTAKIIMLAPEPCDTWAGMTAGDQAIWIDVYKNVRGDGPNPLTGLTVANTAISDSENTGGVLGAAGANTLLAANDRSAAYGGSAAGTGDHVHEWSPARRVKALAVRAILNAQGVGPP